MLTNILGTLLLFPFIILVVLLIIAKKIGLPKKKRIGWAVDWTTPFMAITVLILIRAIWDVWLPVLIIGVLCLIAIGFAVKERSSEKEFRTFWVLRRTWRAFFLLLTAAYILLFILGIVIQIVQYVK
ncbi:hypothetical protein SporoP37_14140 [Sporosarcina sp. P37]|uniref:DUF3397 family protein n=1 Tax=unclassified Sporosarcina TaxID=2647733 RepID=UPI0009C1D2E4|nr:MULTISPECIES: DUF3397 family protein [unclassified Sporosarcina]ARD49208.1 hypothetical protein SporoP33_13805 [Sporosarcina sp. P33]ARK25683.1 hypothetical protein SporoP37_14140 [Sporosarcina sp. P37]